ncbi:Uncharacterized protein APZ42_016574 [Daphnia magna]|uniref:Uncharacterized protein n=1 Tax=Daphnia magna TaxID=35525 RepID=A0A165AH29_9CRUS|nr:Uncharacterized protein APZ42_016574 [Daphnia magna]
MLTTLTRREDQKKVSPFNLDVIRFRLVVARFHKIFEKATELYYNPVHVPVHLELRQRSSCARSGSLKSFYSDEIPTSMSGKL